jgi:Domain of unknown function (DUF4440)
MATLELCGGRFGTGRVRLCRRPAIVVTMTICQARITSQQFPTIQPGPRAPAVQVLTRRQIWHRSIMSSELDETTIKLFLEGVNGAMKKFLSVLVLATATALLAFSQFGCASPQNTNTSAVSTPTPEPTPDKSAIEAELTKTENDWPRIIKERDAAAVRRLEADDIFIIYPDGSTGTKEQDVKEIEAGSTTADSWEISDVKVNVLSKDAAVVVLRNTVKNGKVKSPDGRSLDISGQYFSQDTFARRNGQWQTVASISVKVQAPNAMASPTPKASPSPGASPAVKPTPSPRPTPSPKATPALKGTPVPKPSPVMKPAATPVKTKTP